MIVSASLVLFQQEPQDYQDSIQSFLDGCNGHLYIIDNSATPLRHPLFLNPRVSYFFAGANLGFGKAHNLALAKLNSRSDIHIFLNPDVCFPPEAIPIIIVGFNTPGVGAIMPRVEYPDGSLQRLCKLLPTPIDLIFRRFVPVASIRNKLNQRYELHQLNQGHVFDIPSLSACFLAVRTSLLVKIGGFDERYFMYMEDVDLVRRIGDHARTVYDPSARIVHAYAKGSYKNKKLLHYHLRSAIRYFNKWGWFFDKTRRTRNALIRRKISELR